MSSFTHTLRYLYGLQHRGMKFGLRNTKTLLAWVGNPERTFASIHIAGTNGKGSTASYLASIAREGGYRTGLYTSPHLVHFSERIRVDCTPIPEDEVVRYTRLLRPVIERVKATFFEATTCMAFLYFAEQRIDLAIIETGLGGRLDATNVLRPLVSVITSIGLDHTEILGTSVRAIAREKGGIIKKHTPCVTGSTDPAALKVLTSIARRREARLFHSRRMVRVTRHTGSHSQMAFTCRRTRIGKVLLGLQGEHQVRNAQTAIATCQVMIDTPDIARRFPRIRLESVIRRGLANVVHNTGLHGRFETINLNGRWIFDVAHNPEGIKTLVAALNNRLRRKYVVVFGVMADKDVDGMLAALLPWVKTLVVVSARTPRALGVRALREKASLLGIPTIQGGNVLQGCRKAGKLAETGEPVLVTGSHYVVGEAYSQLFRHHGS